MGLLKRRYAERHMKIKYGILIVGMILPTLGALGYFVLFSEEAWAKVLYLGVKLSMVGIGLWGWHVSGMRIRDALVRRNSEVIKGVMWGLIFAGIVILGAYGLWEMLLPAKAAVTTKTTSLIPLAWYGVAAVMFSIFHAFFEEWYWRGYVTHALGEWMHPSVAIGVSAAAFTGHHIVVLSQMFSWQIVALGSVGVFTAGVIWSMLWRKTSSLTAPWISHIFADIAIFFVGFLLMSA